MKNSLRNHDTPKFKQALTAVLERSHAADFVGYGKFDALNSPILKTFSLDNKWLRLIASQAVKLSPVNIRPFLAVKQYKNPKGMALFARAYLNQYLLTGKESDANLGKYCLDWLAENASPGFSGACWGYLWDWQDLGFYAPFGSPNCVVTTFVGQALLDGYERLGSEQYLELARSSVDFILNDLKVLYEDEEMKCLSYVPDVSIQMVVMDVSALAGAFIARVVAHTGEAHLMDEAQALLNYVVNKQTDYGAWFYTHPAGDSPVKHDNYHTGFILNTLLVYEKASNDVRFRDAYRRGLDFYADQLFMPDGAPKWMSDKQYPYDIHGAATGIGTFARAARFEDPKWLMQAEKLAHWAIDRMQKPDGNFRYQRGRFMTKHFTLMRWCNAWTSFGLSELLLAYD